MTGEFTLSTLVHDPKFRLRVAAHALIHNHFNTDRHLNRRDIFKQNRAAALAEWRCQGIVRANWLEPSRGHGIVRLNWLEPPGEVP